MPQAADPPARRRAAVGLGANLGDAPTTLAWAVAAMARLPGTRVLAVSSLWRSTPVQAQGPDFSNAVVLLLTALSPSDLLEELQKLEQLAGRTRPYRNAPRTLDLDVLQVSGVCCDTPTLTLPHPRWRQRAFVLYPLAEVAPDWVNPADLAAVADQMITRQDCASWSAIIMNSV